MSRRPSASKRGYDRRWRMAREEFLFFNRDCVRCGQPATVVDHIHPHNGDQRLFWNRRNWQPLCAYCHSSSKQSEEKGGTGVPNKKRPMPVHTRPGSDTSGLPTDPLHSWNGPKAQ